MERNWPMQEKLVLKWKTMTTKVSKIISKFPQIRTKNGFWHLKEHDH